MTRIGGPGGGNIPKYNKQETISAKKLDAFLKAKAEILPALMEGAGGAPGRSDSFDSSHLHVDEIRKDNIPANLRAKYSDEQLDAVLGYFRTAHDIKMEGLNPRSDKRNAFSTRNWTELKSDAFEDAPLWLRNKSTAEVASALSEHAGMGQNPTADVPLKKLDRNGDGRIKGGDFARMVIERGTFEHGDPSFPDQKSYEGTLNDQRTVGYGEKALVAAAIRAAAKF